jgi:dolichyl-phosphate beta-glucosyltransferase
MSLSLVIPCYNEEDRFREKIPEILVFMSMIDDKELVLVNDGSTDSTEALMLKVGARNPWVKVITYKDNKGKGYALRKGVLASSKESILVSDIDLSTPLKEFWRLNQYAQYHDIVIGSRANSNIEVKQNIVKRVVGKGGNLLIRLILGLNLKDTQCGFKLFKSTIKPIFEKAKVNGFGYDFEILYLAQKKGLFIKECAVIWNNDFRSKVKLKHYFKTLAELVKIKWFDWNGKYA